MAFILIWAMVYAAGVWWVAHASGQQQRAAEVHRVEALADNLATGVEPLLAGDELSAVRRLLSEAAFRDGLEECRLILGDGRPLVDADQDQKQLTAIPMIWPANTSSTSSGYVINGKAHIERSVHVPNKGDATLTLIAQLPSSHMAIQPLLPMVALVGLGGMVGSLLIYRKLRGRLAVLTLIRGAMLDASVVTPDLSELAVDPRWGAEAEGWNRVLAGRQLDDQSALDIALQKNNARSEGGMLEDACNAMSNGLLLADARGRVIYLNGAACTILQSDPDRAIGVPLHALLTDETLARQSEQMLSGKGPGRCTHEIVVGEGTVTSTIRVTLRRQNENSALVIQFEDVTQQRIADSSRHEFVTRATHELRTPLTNIRLYVETAQEDGQDDPELRGECLNVISRESQRLERLVSEMLSVSEIEAGSMSIRHDDVRLDQLFKTLQQDYTAGAQSKRIELRFDLPPKLPAIRGDRDKLAIVLQNLLGNAIKYTPENGKVDVGVDLTATELTVEVRDSGIGIGEEDLPRVFEKFYRANDPRLGEITGSGLGLALAHEIARMHGGDLTVESELNVGSTFRLTLPITAEGV